MRIHVVGAGVIGTVYGGRLAEAGHDVTILARGSRLVSLNRSGVRLLSDGKSLVTRPRISTTDQLGPAADLVIVAVRATQLDTVLDLLDNNDSPVVAFLQHLGPHADQVRLRVGVKRSVLAFPGIGGLIRPDGEVEYIEIAAQPTTIDVKAAHADVLRAAIASTGMRTALEPDMPAWHSTHSVFITCLGAGILASGGMAEKLARDSSQLTMVIQAIREGFAALNAAGIAITPTALRILFSRMPRWFATAYWRRALVGPVGTVAMAPHTRASRNDEFPALCATVLQQVGNTAATPTLTDLLTPWTKAP